MIRVYSWSWLALGLSLAGFVVFSFANYHFVRVTDGPAAGVLHAAGFGLSLPLGFALQRALRFWEAVLGHGRG